MTSMEVINVLAIVFNVLAIVCSPLIALYVGRKLQDREKKRNDKMLIFRSLMMDRGLGWSTESMRALNIIEIVFADDAKVLKQWKKFYQALCIQDPNPTQTLDIENARAEFLVTMAESLGYKESITKEIIQNAYIPKGLSKSIEQQQQYQKNVLEIMTMFLSKLINNGENMESKNEENNDGKNANGNA